MMLTYIARPFCSYGTWMQHGEFYWSFDWQDLGELRDTDSQWIVPGTVPVTED